ncbi:MAG TPA: glycosyltransferase [Candidatus Limnocylindrales bacterium]
MPHAEPDRARQRRPVAMLSHSYYEEDPRVRREAEALVAGGRPVDVFALRRPDDPDEGELDGVRIHRLDVQRHQGAGIATYLREYLAFLGRAGAAVTRRQRSRRYALVQVHSMPDFLAFAGLPLRVAGVPLLLDLHEAMPEFFPVRFPRASNPVASRLLRWQERLAILAATHAITVNGALRDRLIGLGVPARKVSIVPNHPSLGRFDPAAAPARPFLADGVLRLAYAGAVTPVYELDVAVDAVARLRELRPDLRTHLDVYGRGDSEQPLRARVARLGLDDAITLHGRIPLEDVPAAIAAADIGIAPTHLDSYTRFSLSTKIFEYGAMARPAIATRLPLVETTFGADAVATYIAGDADDLARVVLRLVDDPAEREARVAATSRLVAELGWEQTARDYLALVERLASDGLSFPAEPFADRDGRDEGTREDA